MEKFKRILPLFCLLLLAACEKEEPLWTLPPTGPEQLAKIGMGENYDHAIFFDLATGKMTERDPNAWELAFATGSTDFTVLMNGGKGVQVYPTGETTFSKVYTAGATTEWIWDNPNGHKDSTAIGTWLNDSNQSAMQVYLLDLGASCSPRYRKIQFMGANSQAYVVKYANLDNSGERIETIAKDSSANYTCFSLQTNSTVDFEPDVRTWDIVFTKYRHVFYDKTPVTPYYVTGVLSNCRKMKVAKTAAIRFEDITVENASALTFSDDMNAIGYDWKAFDLNVGKYVVNSKTVYIVKCNDGYMYKLRFVDFYNEQGLKGYPQFVYQRL